MPDRLPGDGNEREDVRLRPHCDHHQTRAGQARAVLVGVGEDIARGDVGRNGRPVAQVAGSLNDVGLPCCAGNGELKTAVQTAEKK